MDIYEKYDSCWAGMKDRIAERKEKGEMTALGFTSNLDILCDFQTEILNELLEKYMPEGVLAEMKAVPLIRTMEDFLSTVVYYCREGIGGENDIDDFAVIRDAFPVRLGMGGTGTQGAMALAAVGCPSLVHLTDDSPEVCRLLDEPPIFTVDKKGNLAHTGGLPQTEEQEIHYIIQFQKGSEIRLGGQKVTIPTSNRLIVTKITVNATVPFSKPFLIYVEDHAKSVKSCVLSSFNCILDQDVLEKRLLEAKEHVIRYRYKNPDGVVYFEDAHYHSTEIKQLCLSWLYPEIDIAGLNEEELKYTVGLLGGDVDLGDINSCVEAARFLRGKFDVRRGVVVHTKDYAMYVGDNADSRIERGLMYGNLMATAKAMTGWYGDFSALEKVMQLPLSPKGLEHRKQLEAEKTADVVLVPSKYIDKPKFTIGLGDSFVAGVQITF